MAGLASSWVAAAPVALTKRIEHRRRLAIRTLAEGLGSQEERQTFSDFQAQITISLGNPFKTIVILGGNSSSNLKFFVCVCVNIKREILQKSSFFVGWALVWILARKISSQKVWLQKQKKTKN